MSEFEIVGRRGPFVRGLSLLALAVHLGGCAAALEGLGEIARAYSSTVSATPASDEEGDTWFGYIVTMCNAHRLVSQVFGFHDRPLYRQVITETARAYLASNVAECRGVYPVVSLTYTDTFDKAAADLAKLEGRLGVDGYFLFGLPRGTGAD